LAELFVVIWPKEESEWLVVLSIHKFLVDGVADEFSGGVETELFEHAPAVGADGLGADKKLPGDYFGRFTRDEKLEDCVFAVGEPFMGPFQRLAGQATCQFLRDGVTNGLAAGKDCFDSGNEFGRSSVFGDVTGGAGFEGPQSVLFLGMHAENQDRKLGLRLFNTSKDFQAAGARHADIQHEDIPPPFPDLIEGLLGGPSFSEPGARKMILQHLFEAMPNNGVIICN